MWHQTYEAARSIAHYFPRAKKMIPAPVFNGLKSRLRSLGIAESPDRVIINREILPSLAALKPGRILFVGCQAYTARYGRWFNNGTTDYWTIDIDPDSAHWGSPGHHVIDGVQNLGAHFRRQIFDAIVLNGVIGFGLNEPAAIEQGLRACHAALKPNGILLVGWNTDHSDDPLGTDTLQRLFLHRDALGIGDRRTVSGCTHVYDTFVARPES